MSSTSLIFINGRFYLCKSKIGTGPSIVYKLNGLFVKLDSIVYNGCWVTELHSTKNNLVLNGFVMQSPCNSGNLGDKVIIDTNFTYVSCTPLSTYSTSSDYNKVIPISDTKFLAAGNQDYGLTSPAYKKIVNTIFDQNNNILSSTAYQLSNRNIEYCGEINFIAIEQGKILTVGVSGINPFSNMPDPKTKIWVNKIDSSGTTVWVKQYGGEKSYSPAGIDFTNDGGCLISGIRVDTGAITPSTVLEHFLLKLDANGDYLDVGIVENGNVKQQTIKCFPNPSNDKIFFDIPFQFKIEINVYSTLGAMALEIKDYQNLSALDVSGLEKGVYFYKVRTKTNNYSGKFVKE